MECMELMNRVQDEPHKADVNNHGLTASEVRELLKVHRAASQALDQKVAEIEEDKADLRRLVGR